jgi:ribosomal protein S18 acetylase RimI-like enzyme/FMN phosphatase YigB (HAD superfamily)
MKMFIDFDNTLTDGRAFMASIFAQVGKTFDEIISDYREYRKTGEFSIASIAPFFGERGIDAQKLEEVFLRAPATMSKFMAPDARAFLQALKDNGHELILLTRSGDTEIWQRPKVMSSGLAEYFTQIEIHPGEKNTVLRKLGVQQPFVFIDDTAEQIDGMKAAFPESLCLKHTPGSSLIEHLPEINAYVAAHEAPRAKITERAVESMPTLPLPINTSVIIGDCVLSDGEKLTISLGLDGKAVEEFKKRSCDQSDTELMKFTSDYQRICLGSYETWYAKERYPFALINSGGELAGLIWFGPKEFPAVIDKAAPTSDKTWQTFAIRMYGDYRGKRLASPFARFAFQMRDFLFKESAVWLDTDAENVGAVKLYTKLGFTEYGFTESGRLVMVRL